MEGTSVTEAGIEELRAYAKARLFAFGVRNARDVADEVVSETLLRAEENPAPQGSEWIAWAKGIARNVLSAFARDKDRRKEVTWEADVAWTVLHDGESDLLEILQPVFAGFEFDRQACCAMRWFGHMQYAQLAKWSGLAQGSVSTHVTRGRAEMQAAINRARGVSTESEKE